MVIWLHYSADPSKDEKWAEEARKKCASIEEWNREYEIDFSTMAGKRCYPGFRRDIHARHLRYIPHREIWRGWDFGYGHPACVWVQVNDNGRLNILRELMIQNTTIDKFSEEVERISAKEFPMCSRFFDAGDPSCRHVSDKSERTSMDILRHKGIRIQYRYVPVKDGINLIRRLLIVDAVGASKIAMDDRYCPVLTEGFGGGYCLEDVDDLVPIKDGFYDHLQDALRYVAVVLYSTINAMPIERGLPSMRNRTTASAITGY